MESTPKIVQLPRERREQQLSRERGERLAALHRARFYAAAIAELLVEAEPDAVHAQAAARSLAVALEALIENLDGAQDR